MKKSNVRAVVRARPSDQTANNIFVFNEAANVIELRLPKDNSAGSVNNQQESMRFELDKVMSNAGQEQVYDSCAAEVVRSVMEGYNGAIMAYGQTGAGKTYTMTGGHVGFADRGIVPRAIRTIYEDREEQSENNITIRLSYAEIYNELVFDLFTDVGVAEQSGDLVIVEGTRGNVEVRGLSMPVASSPEEALHWFFQGDTNRHVAEHALNKGSTRSHCVFTIYVESRSRVESSEKVTFSKLHLVDLAGSERVKKTGTDGMMLKEATYINKSLTFLEQVVIALGNKNRSHIPYRQSKLTHMLKDSIGGNCKTTMIANIWCEASHVEETTSTLRFATRMMRVSNEATVNVHLDPQLLIRKYERQVKELKQELAMHDTLAGRSRVQYEDYTPDEQRELEAKVKAYLNEDIQEIEIVSLRMATEAFSIFRKLYKSSGRKDFTTRPVTGGQTTGGGPDAQADDSANASLEPEQREGEVGEDEEGRGGISVGIAPSSSRPVREDRGPAGSGEFGADADRDRDQTSRPSPTADEERTLDKQAVFADWKVKEGHESEEAFEKNRSELRMKRSEMRDAMNVANAKKRDIDDAKERLAQKQAEKDPRASRDDEPIDEEEYALIKSLKDTKQQYREAFERHRALKMEVVHTERLMQQSKAKLVQAFEEYYDQKYGSMQNTVGASISKDTDGERYDPEEAFEMMQSERLEMHSPEAVDYIKAKKNAARDVRQKRLGASTMVRSAR